jgi:hypothetical protein
MPESLTTRNQSNLCRWCVTYSQIAFSFSFFLFFSFFLEKGGVGCGVRSSKVLEFTDYDCLISFDLSQVVDFDWIYFKLISVSSTE